MATELQVALHEGNVLASRGDLAAAEIQFARARTLAPNDMHAALGLGHVLRLLRRPGDARTVFAEAIAIMPDLADAHQGLALACHELSDFSAAEASYRTVLRLEPTSVEGAIGLAEMFIVRKHADEALVLLAPFAGSDAPTAAAIVHVRGLAHLLKDGCQSALALFDDALALDPTNLRASCSRALALDRLGREEDALAAYRKVIAAHPIHMPAHQGLNDLLLRLGRNDEFLRSYDEAALRMPGAPELALAKGDFLARVGNRDDAITHYVRGLILAPDDPVTILGKAAALVTLGRTAEAIDLYEGALRQAPDDVQLLTSLSTAHLMARDAGKAEAAAARAVRCEPTDQVGLAALGTAWRMQGNDREHELNRYDEFVRVIDLAAPDGYGDMESFNHDLGAWLDTQHASSVEPMNQSLRGGTQTKGDLFLVGNRLVQALRARIQAAVADFIESLPADAAHPFLGRRTQGFRFAGWSSRLSDRGFHANHLHPEGWISSAYYVALPDVVADTQNKEGWLQFGEPSYDVGFSKPVRRAVQPRLGRLVLFPSYMWHGTLPFHARQHRTTIAFDVAPAKR
jgi:tetratricopeptide (TPR) repeat protein